MGISDRHHFTWLRDAVEQFERQTDRLAAVKSATKRRHLWCLGGQRVDPAIEYIRDTLGRGDTSLEFFDKFPRVPGVVEVDLNALDVLPDDACDVLVVFRASYFVADPQRFLGGVRRLLRPGGLAFVDWLHGLSDAPVLDLRGDPRYGGGSTPFMTTYADHRFLMEFPQEFEAFIRHVNRPPAWTNPDSPGAPVAVAARVWRMLGGGVKRSLTLATYLDALRTDVSRAGKFLIEPDLMEQYFRVVFRHARYFWPVVRKFNLYLLTVLEPVGK